MDELLWCAVKCQKCDLFREIRVNDIDFKFEACHVFMRFECPGCKKQKEIQLTKGESKEHYRPVYRRRKKARWL